MPEMDGIETTGRIRNLKLNPEPIIIALTANAMKGNKEKYLEAGMNDYLSKPLLKEDLLKKLIFWKEKIEIFLN
ncbi:MAG: response regulator, partial [Leptospiraceae bacterium]|nr:response regulator [Leptospiraceae bacterium]